MSHDPATHAIVQTSDASFEDEVIRAGRPVLVDFWAPWCGPCRTISPLLEALAEERADQLTLAKLNVDDNPKTATSYGIKGIPTLMLFKDGAVIATKIGAAPKAALAAWLDDALDDYQQKAAS